MSPDYYSNHVIEGEYDDVVENLEIENTSEHQPVLTEKPSLSKRSAIRVMNTEQTSFLFPAIPQCQGVCFKDLEGSFRYPLAREGVYASGGHVCLAHFMQKFSNIVDLTVLRLAFFMGYGSNKVVQ